MKSVTIIAATTALLPLAQAISLSQPRDASPRVFNLDIQRHPVSKLPQNDQLRIRRRQTVTQTLDNEEGSFYFANISLGTPAQALHVVIDTGSSDLWINAANSTLCSQSSDACSESGTYDAGSSSTSNFVSANFNISYADGSGASGSYLTDTIAVGGKELENFQFGVGFESTSSQGVFGVGYSTNEALAQYTGTQPYDNLPLAMQKAGLIATPSYSLWLNDLDASTGQILFGGVNTDKYDGDLSTLPILPEADGTYAEFLIALTGLSYKPQSGDTRSYTDALPAAVLLDSGSTFTYLPDEVVSSIYTDLNAQYDSRDGSAYVSCDTSGSMEFTFSDPTISVDIQGELLFEVTDARGRPLQFDDGSQVCLLGISPAGGSTIVLGDTFLRSAYVVYDLANNEISLAQTTFNSTTDNIQEITSGSSGVPGATAVANAVTTVAVATGGARGPGAIATSNPSGISTGGDSNAAAHSHPAGQVALGIIAAGAALMAAVL